MNISDICFCLKISFLFVFSSSVCSTLPAALVRQSIIGRETSVSGRQLMMWRGGKTDLIF